MKRIFITLATLATVARAELPAIATTYALHYTEAARSHGGRRYHPDSLCVATGWRWLRGQTLILWHGEDSVRVRVMDVMNARYDTARTLHIDCSPAVMRRLRLRGRAWITVQAIRP